MTHDWWEQRADDFEIYISQYVVDEISRGDEEAAQQRLEMVAGMKSLHTNDEIVNLAESFLNENSMPQKARVDALHLATAAIHGVDYLLTWNCRHLANAALWNSMTDVCRDHGLEIPAICTPQELMEGTR